MTERPGMFRSVGEAVVILGLTCIVSGLLIGGLIFAVTAMVGAP